MSDSPAGARVTPQQLLQAARVYAQGAGRLHRFGTYALLGLPKEWPWDARYYAPTGDPVEDLKKAQDLIDQAISMIREERKDDE